MNLNTSLSESTVLIMAAITLVVFGIPILFFFVLFSLSRRWPFYRKLRDPSLLRMFFTHLCDGDEFTYFFTGVLLAFPSIFWLLGTFITYPFEPAILWILYRWQVFVRLRPEPERVAEPCDPFDCRMQLESGS